VRVTNDDAGIHFLLGKLTPLAPTLIVSEAMDGYQVLTVAALTVAGLAECVKDSGHNNAHCNG
jgi:hypothetical protein